ncbi:MAG: hypothetical protein O9309_05325 [Rhizobium sp.]|nr:hypothetical protein [Rhizobium sp.]MCZ8348949.1 hypothetical protein [Rhizobium sp.]
MKADTGVRLRAIKDQIARNDQEKAAIERQREREERVRKNRAEGVGAIWPRFVEALDVAAGKIHQVTTELDPPILLDVRDSTSVWPHVATLTLTRNRLEMPYSLTFEADENGSVSARYKSPINEGTLGQFEVFSASTDDLDALLVEFLQSYAEDERSIAASARGS